MEYQPTPAIAHKPSYTQRVIKYFDSAASGFKLFNEYILLFCGFHDRFVYTKLVINWA